LSAISEIGLDSYKYALHSLRVVVRLLPQTIKSLIDLLRYTDDTAKDGYIEDSIEQKILVSMNLGL
jgi:hypothetical protein